MATKELLPATMVQTFVGVAHGDLERVKAMLAEEPSLANACWDWGGGDFETALGAAAHMGHRAIAEYLLERGARLDLFAAAMLGKMAIVHASLEDDANVVHVKGPHGIPLLNHAEAGGQDEIVALIRSYGA